MAETGEGDELDRFDRKKGPQPQAEVVRSLEKKIEERTGQVAAAEGRLADKDREIENLKRLLEQRYHSEEGRKEVSKGNSGESYMQFQLARGDNEAR